MLEIRGLGKFLVWKDGIALDRFGSSKAEALLVYLAQEGGLSSRRALATMLWPESPEKNAQTSLRVALSVLRKKVGEYLEITREGVRINPESIVELDSFLLEQSLACGDISRAVDLYRGEWLQDIQIPDSNAFENWRRWEQEHLNMLMVNALQDALAVELARGRYQQAQELANMLISIDPLNETAHQRFLAALALEGKRNEALGHFQRFPCSWRKNWRSRRRMQLRNWSD